MVIKALHTAGFLDISSNESLGLDNTNTVEKEPFRVYLTPGQTIEVEEKWMALRSIKNALNSGLISIEFSDSVGYGQSFSKTTTVVSPKAPLMISSWSAPWPARVFVIRGRQMGGATASINVYKNGTIAHLASDMILTTPGQWFTTSTVQNVDYLSGDFMEVGINGVTGSNQITVQVDFVRIG